MPFPLLAAAGIGALMGALKNKDAQSREASQRKEAAEIMRWSPWSGMQAGQIQRAGSLGGDVLGGAAGGLAVGSSLGAGAEKAATADPGWTDEFGVKQSELGGLTPQQLAQQKTITSNPTAYAGFKKTVTPASTSVNNANFQQPQGAGPWSNMYKFRQDELLQPQSNSWLYAGNR